MSEPVILSPVRVPDLRKGDVIYTRKYHDMGGDKGRPAVVLALYDGSVVVAYMTKKRQFYSPEFRVVTEATGTPSLILLNRISTISQDRVLKRVGRVTPDELGRINVGLSLLLRL